MGEFTIGNNETPLNLDAMTARLLASLAEAWGVSEDEAIRRALKNAIARTDISNKEGRLEAFKELQRSLNLTPAKAAEWQDTVRRARC